MVERSYKTKLCVLYRRGHCPRQNCSFAHGEAELRRFSSFHGRRERDYRDLRDKLGRRRSPPRKFFQRRDARGHNEFYGYSPSRSLGRSERKYKRRDRLDVQSDCSGSLKVSDGAGDINKERASSDSKNLLEEQLKKVQVDVDTLEDRKCQLEVYLEERAQEVDSLTSRIQELESQLYSEKEEFRRINLKIKKFIKAHHRYSRIQEELKRSQSRLQKLGDQLSSDIHRANGDDSSINILSEGEHGGNQSLPARNELLSPASSPSRKRSQASLEGAAEAKRGKFSKGYAEGTARSDRASRWRQLRQLTDNKEPEEATERSNNISDFGGKVKQGRSGTRVRSADKVKNSELGHGLPSTSMAAHPDDEYVDMVEPEDRNIKEEVGQEEELGVLTSPSPKVTTGKDGKIDDFAEEMVDVDTL